MNMDIKEAIINIYIVLLFLACIYVPWKISYGFSSLFWGYSPIWSPPGSVIHDQTFNVSIDWKRLILEIIVITVFSVAFYGLIRVLETDKRNQKTEEKETE